MKLYSKDNIVSALASMKINDRLSHGFLLVGDKGTGRKTAAAYIAKVLMCESCVNGIPCGVCRHCKRIDEGTHPDVIRPERSGKKQIYNKDTMRSVCTDAYTAPNDCDAKVYIFSDCESIEEKTQNLMLKLIEEPPDTAYFIFTASSKGVFLPTVLSRVITFGVTECTEDECREALSQKGDFTPQQIDEAVKTFHGNIGSCSEYLSDGEISEYVKQSRAITDCIISGDEYTLGKVLASIGDNREKIKAVMQLTDKIIRDACIIRLNSEGAGAALIGCYPEGSQRLAAKLSFRRAENVHEALGNMIGYCAANVNVAAAAAYLAGVLAG